jgi:hypothetical protein
MLQAFLCFRNGSNLPPGEILLPNELKVLDVNKSSLQKTAVAFWILLENNFVVRMDLGNQSAHVEANFQRPEFLNFMV